MTEVYLTDCLKAKIDQTISVGPGVITSPGWV
jgi:hypothetical protein